MVVCYWRQNFTRVVAALSIHQAAWISPFQGKETGAGACFSKVPKRFGRISGDIIQSLCIFKTKASRGKKLRSYFYFYFLYNMWKDQLYRIYKLVVVFRMAFRARQVLGTFESRAPGACFSKGPKAFRVRKAIRKTPAHLFCKVGLFRCCKGNKRLSNCKFHT